MNARCAIRPSRRPRVRPARGEESGYTLLLVVFFAALMIIAASIAVPSLITQNRRQKEKLLIWRGRQYARAIGLYYHKTGHYPHNLKELKKGVAGLHFLRKEAYNDPINSQDGSWRLIYIGPGGQLIGSLRWKTLAQYEAVAMGLPMPKAKKGEKGKGKDKDKSTSTNGQLGEASFDESNSFSQPHPKIINEGDMIGGNLIGVASKVKAKSLKVYMGAKNYRDWEFIWNPLQGKKGGIQTTTPAPTGGSKPTKPGTSNPSTPPKPEPPTSQQSQQP